MKKSLQMPPEKLRLLIERVGLLPPGVELPTLSNGDYDFVYGSNILITDEAHDWTTDSKYLKSKYVREWIHETRCILEESLEDMPEELQLYIWGGDAPKISPSIELKDPAFDLSSVWKVTSKAAIKYKRFTELLVQFEFLIILVERVISDNSAWGKSIATVSLQNTGVSRTVEMRSIYKIGLGEFPASANYVIDHDGVMRIHLDEFSQAINGADVTRIRKCRKCGKIFWARRADAICCSQECSNSYHVMRTYNKRKQNPENYRWEQIAKKEAKERADKELLRIGFNKEIIKEYQRKHRTHPRTAIYDFLKDRFIELGKRPPSLLIPKRLIKPLQDFLLK